MQLTEQLAKAQQLFRWIAARQDGQVSPGDDRARLPGLLADLVIEHHAGIVHLATAQVYGSAFALVRCQFEALVRAIWLSRCATDDELESFRADDKIPNVYDMISGIERQPPFATKFLSRVKDAAWVAMHGYTHGGVHQIGRRFKDGTIEPCYEPEEVIEVLRFSGSFALMALREIAEMAGDNQTTADTNGLLDGSIKDLPAP